MHMGSWGIDNEAFDVWWYILANFSNLIDVLIIRNNCLLIPSQEQTASDHLVCGGAMWWTLQRRRCYNCFSWRWKQSVFQKVEVGVANISRARSGVMGRIFFHSQLKGSGFHVGSLPFNALVRDAKPWPTFDIYSQLCSVCSVLWIQVSSKLIHGSVSHSESSTFRDRFSAFVSGSGICCSCGWFV